MQAVMDTSAMPRGNMLFARKHGRDYMMRSEKRNGYNYGGAAPGGKKPKRKRKRAGFFYIFIALLLSVILWPLGMIMLWRRKVRWKLASKLLTSILTLVLCVCLFGFGLTVQTDNPDFTKAQDSVNDFLDTAVVKIGEGYTVICEKAVEVSESAANVGSAMARYGLNLLADGLDEAMALTGDAYNTVAGWMGVEPTAEPTAEPEPTEKTTVQPTAKPTQKPAVSPSASVAPTATEKAVLAIGESAEPVSVSPAATDAPEVTDEATESATIATQVVASATGKAPEATATAEPTNTPVPTEIPTPAPTEAPVLTDDLIPTPAGEATVYYNASGKLYHMYSSCKGMSSAKEHTLAEAIADGKRSCRVCGTPDASILEVENAVWTDENSHFHLSSKCAEFMGDWTLMSLEDATENGYLPCVNCRSGLYMTALGITLPTPTPTPAPTPSPTPEPTATPEPEMIIPSVTLKPAAEAMLYHSSNGGWYHTIHNCSGMGGAKLYTLESCIEDGLKVCRKCGAPKPELLDEHCLWLDAQELCHTSDKCEAFDGKWTLIPRDEALDAGHSGCTVCGADEYLKPNTLVAYPAE